MKNTCGLPPEEQDDALLPEYDFSKMSGYVRGQYSQAYRAGHAVRIIKEDGCIELHFLNNHDQVALWQPETK